MKTFCYTILRDKIYLLLCDIDNVLSQNVTPNSAPSLGIPLVRVCLCFWVPWGSQTCCAWAIRLSNGDLIRQTWFGDNLQQGDTLIPSIVLPGSRLRDRTPFFWLSSPVEGPVERLPGEIFFVGHANKLVFVFGLVITCFIDKASLFLATFISQGVVVQKIIFLPVMLHIWTSDILVVHGVHPGNGNPKSQLGRLNPKPRTGITLQDRDKPNYLLSTQKREQANSCYLIKNT